MFINRFEFEKIKQLTWKTANATKMEAIIEKPIVVPVCSVE